MSRWLFNWHQVCKRAADCLFIQLIISAKADPAAVSNDRKYRYFCQQNRTCLCPLFQNGPKHSLKWCSLGQGTPMNSMKGKLEVSSGRALVKTSPPPSISRNLLLDQAIGYLNLYYLLSWVQWVFLKTKKSLSFICSVTHHIAANQECEESVSFDAVIAKSEHKSLTEGKHM